MTTFPSMACCVLEQPQPHRERNPIIMPVGDACVARSVGKAEIAREPKAQESLQKEWDKLRAAGPNGCWDESKVREWTRGRCGCQNLRQDCPDRDGSLRSVLKRTPSCLLESPARKYKGRVVFMGNQVRDQKLGDGLVQ